jgi:hypothetical protein
VCTHKLTITKGERERERNAAGVDRETDTHRERERERERDTVEDKTPSRIGSLFMYPLSIEWSVPLSKTAGERERKRERMCVCVRERDASNSPPSVSTICINACHPHIAHVLCIGFNGSLGEGYARHSLNPR